MLWDSVYTTLSWCVAVACGCVWGSFLLFFFQAEDGIRDLVRSRGLGDVYKRQGCDRARRVRQGTDVVVLRYAKYLNPHTLGLGIILSLIHI